MADLPMKRKRVIEKAKEVTQFIEEGNRTSVPLYDNQPPILGVLIIFMCLSLVLAIPGWLYGWLEHKHAEALKKRMTAQIEAQSVSENEFSKSINEATAINFRFQTQLEACQVTLTECQTDWRLQHLKLRRLRNQISNLRQPPEETHGASSPDSSESTGQ